MIRTADYTTGWIDSTIHQFLSDLETPSSSMKFTLITCLDSSFNVSSALNTSSALQPVKKHAKVIGDAVLLSTAKLVSAERNRRIFHGFDELWFFPARAVTTKPRQFCITGPEKLSPDPPPALVEWMEENKCSLALGDGTGLNFIAKLRGVAKHLFQELTASRDGNGPV